jgi:hypothetical protein
MASLSVHRFDRALAYDVIFPIASCCFIFNNKKKLKKKLKNLEEFAGFFFSWLIRYCMHSYLTSQFGLY